MEGFYSIDPTTGAWILVVPGNFVAMYFEDSDEMIFSYGPDRMEEISIARSKEKDSLDSAVESEMLRTIRVDDGDLKDFQDYYWDRNFAGAEEIIREIFGSAYAQAYNAEFDEDDDEEDED